MDRPGRCRASASASTTGSPSAPGSRRAEAASWQRTIELGFVAAISGRQRASACGNRSVVAEQPNRPRADVFAGLPQQRGRHRVVEAPADVQAPHPLQGEARVIGLAGHRG